MSTEVVRRPLPRGEEVSPPVGLAALGRRGLTVGVVGLAVAAGGFVVSSEHFYRAYLSAYVLVLGVALGSLALMMLHHLSRGEWGLVSRRVLEAATRTIPLLAVLFLPIALGMKVLYPWADLGVVAGDPILQKKAAYLNVTFFGIRWAIYFAIWWLLANRLSSHSRRQDETGDLVHHQRMRYWSGAGLPLYFLTTTFASVDWLMSLDPHWFSSLFGMLFIVGQGLTAFAFVIVVNRYLVAREPMSRFLTPGNFHDLGKLLFAFVFLWAYLTASQLIIVWSGNLPEEITYYIDRTSGTWLAVTLVLAAAHFAIPFAALLSRSLKRHPERLVWVAIGLLGMRWVDIFWQVAPTAAHGDHGGGFHWSLLWVDLAAVVGLGGLWFWLFALELAKRPLLPVRDPFLPEAFGHE